MTDIRAESQCASCGHAEAFHRSRPPHGPIDYVDCLALNGGCECNGFRTEAQAEAESSGLKYVTVHEMIGILSGRIQALELALVREAEAWAEFAEVLRLNPFGTEARLAARTKYRDVMNATIQKIIAGIATEARRPLLDVLAEARRLSKALGLSTSMAGTMGDLARVLASLEETDAAEEYAPRICAECGSLRPFHETTCPGWTAPVEAHWRAIRADERTDKP